MRVTIRDIYCFGIGLLIATFAMFILVGFTGGQQSKVVFKRKHMSVTDNPVRDESTTTTAAMKTTTKTTTTTTTPTPTTTTAARTRSSRVGDGSWLRLNATVNVTKEIEEARSYCAPIEAVPEDTMLQMFNLTRDMIPELRNAPQFLRYDGSCAHFEGVTCKRYSVFPEKLKPPLWASMTATHETLRPFCFKEKNGLLPEYVYGVCDGRENIAFKTKKRDINVGPDTTKLNILSLHIDAVSYRQYQRAMKLTQASLKSLRHSTVFSFPKYHAVGVNSLNVKYPLYAGIRKPPYNISQPEWIFDYGHEKGFMGLMASNICSDWDRTTKGPQISMGKPHVRGSNMQFMGGDILSRFPIEKLDHLMWPRMFCSRRKSWKAKRPPGEFCFNTSKLHLVIDGPMQAGACIGSQFNWNLVRKFFEDAWTDVYPDIPKFATFTAWESHMENQVGTFWQDRSISRWVNDWYDREDGMGKNTMLLFSSDHGLHMGDWYRTMQGRKENKWPFLHIVLPNGWLQANPGVEAVLNRAQHAVVSSFDLHQTIKHVMNWPNPPSRSADGFGSSLFDPNMSLRRWCNIMGVEGSSCQCQHWYSVGKHRVAYKELPLMAFQTLVDLVPERGTVCRNWNVTTDFKILSMKHARAKIGVGYYLLRFQVGTYQMFEVEYEGCDPNHRWRNCHIRRPPLQITKWGDRMSEECKSKVDSSGRDPQHCECLI